MVQWWLSLSPRTQTALTWVALIPFGLSLPVAISGSGYTWRSVVEVAVFIVIGLYFGRRLRNPIAWELEPEARRELNIVQYSGVPSGDEHIDAIAADRLRERARSERIDRFVAPVYFSLTAIAPVVASVRVDERWLFAAIPNVLALGVWVVVRPPLPSRRLAGLEAALDAQPGEGG